LDDCHNKPVNLNERMHFGMLFEVFRRITSNSG